MIDRYDSSRAHCRKLGHHLEFVYCRTVSDGLPCSKIFDCWFTSLPIAEFINQHYSAEEISRIFAPPKDKITSILELVDKAQQSEKCQPLVLASIQWHTYFSH